MSNDTHEQQRDNPSQQPAQENHDEVINSLVPYKLFGLTLLQLMTVIGSTALILTGIIYYWF